MITAEEESRIIELAYVPEHIVPLMSTISGGEPFFEDGLLYFKGNNWVIIVGYPLLGDYSDERILRAFRFAREKFDFHYLWLVGPSIPDAVKRGASLFLSDRYYTLDLNNFEPCKRVIGQIRKASEKLSIKVSNFYTPRHEALSEAFLREKNPDPFVKGLFSLIGNYLNRSSSALLIDAYDSEEDLVAFYVVDGCARDFLTYLIGCRKMDSKISHASDLIFFKMVEIAREMGKKYIHLGLGVNEGIRKFKEKWGGLPTVPYQFVELRKGLFQMLRGLEGVL